jgi:hypothetical protein
MSYSNLGLLYKISPSTVYKYIEKVTIILSVEFDVPEKGQKIYQVFGKNISGAVDCSVLEKNRTHPNATQFYRGDKGVHFLTLQLYCDLEGFFFFFLFQVKIFLDIVLALVTTMTKVCIICHI